MYLGSRAGHKGKTTLLLLLLLLLDTIIKLLAREELNTYLPIESLSIVDCRQNGATLSLRKRDHGSIY